jgi:hypothetical protein
LSALVILEAILPEAMIFPSETLSGNTEPRAACSTTPVQIVAFRNSTPNPSL